ncbi:MAG: hypothetical protein M5U30_19050 [Burkholderiaceae bacterium]|nr:hypothetical protein [Burkholderiaceae bacterium]
MAGSDAFESGTIMQGLSFAANEIGKSLQPALVFYLLGEEADIELAQRKGCAHYRFSMTHLSAAVARLRATELLPTSPASTWRYLAKVTCRRSNSATF